MKQKSIQNQAVLRFRRFKRKGYAAFCTIHRVVNIGRLASYIADCQLRKSVVTVSVLAPMLFGVAMAQTDDTIEVRQLPTLDIIATADSLQGSPDAIAVITHTQLQGLPVSSVGELLEQLPGLDLRTRGVGDVQGDLTMRGGTFDQMIILLNGVNLTDAQTGHHNLDIPIDLSMVDRVEIIPASALIHYGLSSFCGAVNIVTGEEEADKIRLNLSAGSFGQVNLSAGVTKVVGPWVLSAAAAYHKSDGYRKNTDYSHSSLFLQARRHSANGDWLIQLGGQQKDFGSQAFYSTKYPDQFEATKTATASVTHQRSWNGWQFESSLYGRAHKDRFELFREGVVDAPQWYSGHNYHLSGVVGLRSRASRKWLLGKTMFGGEMREESILSTVLGDSLSAPYQILLEPEGHYYSLGKSRLNTNLFVEHSVYLRKLRLTAGLLGSYNTLMKYNYGYSFSADCPVSESLHVDANFVRSFRLPTYTDLYYKSATQISNPDLNSEESYNADINIRYNRSNFSAVATVYGRHGINIIDWVRLPEESVWHSMNHAEIDAFGGELQASYIGKKFLRRVGVGYSYCTVLQHTDEYVSNYVLDYLRHKISLDCVVSPLKGLRIKTLLDYHYREGSYSDVSGQLVPYSPVLLLNMGAEYDIRFCTIFVEGYNILNNEYCDYGGIPQPGISFLAGVKLNLK